MASIKLAGEVYDIKDIPNKKDATRPFKKVGAMLSFPSGRVPITMFWPSELPLPKLDAKGTFELSIEPKDVMGANANIRCDRFTPLQAEPGAGAAAR